MKPSGIGGMAVMEGVMMKNKDEYAIAVRKPNKEIVVEKNIHKDFSEKVKLFKLPVLRGMMAFVDSMVIGVKVLNFSASFFEEEEDQTQAKKMNKKSLKNKTEMLQEQEKDFAIEELSITDNVSSKIELQNMEDSKLKKMKKDERMNALLMGVAVIISIVISITLFMVLPVLISNIFATFITNRFFFALLEGVIRITILVAYMIAASQMPDIKRVFMYHGAEHKTINCLENGFELTPENVKWQSRRHKRCGTSFMLIVMVISLIFFIFLPPLSLVWRIVSRVLLVPIIAGISYEFIRLAGKSENKLVSILSKPGLMMQGITTREPDDSMIEVAIQSVEAVFDWKGFLETSITADAEDLNAIIKENNKANNKVINKTNNITNNKANKVNNKEENKVDSKAKKEKDNSSNTSHQKQKQGVTASSINSSKPSHLEEEEDEILKALDKYLDIKENTASKAEGNI